MNDMDDAGGMQDTEEKLDTGSIEDARGMKEMEKREFMGDVEEKYDIKSFVTHQESGKNGKWRK